MFLELLRKNASRSPNQTAIRYAEGSLTHGQLVERVEQRARGLIEMGVRAGDRVALVQPAEHELVISFFAVAACRAINVPLNPGVGHDELRFYLSDSDAQWAIVDQPLAGAVAGALESLAQELHVMVVDPSLSGPVPPADRFVGDGPGSGLGHSRADEVVAFMYSSGSTGIPKCVPRTVKQCWHEMAGVLAGLKLTCEDTILCTIPLFHNFGAVHCMLAAMGSCAKLVMLDEPVTSPQRSESILDLVERERVTILPAVPSMLAQLADAASIRDLQSVRLCYSATEPLPLKLARSFEDRFNLRIRQHYGCTETGGLTLDLDGGSLTVDDVLGRPLPGAQIRIVDDRGRMLGAGQVGEIVARSNAMTRGYRRLDALNRVVFRNAYFHTGDLGTLDSHGRLHWRGRKEFMIDTGGQCVSPHEIEAVLCTHTAVHECVVVGGADAQGAGELVRACVVSDGTCSERELLAFCGDRLESAKVPRVVDFVREIPKDPLGRVIRQAAVIDALRLERQAG